jgi:hypothetical protein
MTLVVDSAENRTLPSQRQSLRMNVFRRELSNQPLINVLVRHPLVEKVPVSVPILTRVHDGVRKRVKPSSRLLNTRHI